MECCGSNHETSFCPSCGRRLLEDDPNDIHGLLAHVRKQLKRVRQSQRNLGKKPEKWQREGHAEEVEAMAVRVERWIAWEQCLRELIESQEVTS